MLTVLIVEDEKSIRELLSDFLTDEGYLTLQAGNGPDGLDIARASQPDLILLDLMLPILDGLTVMRTLKDDTATCDIPLIMMSANSALLQIADQQPTDATIRKPFDLDQMLDLIQARLGVGTTTGLADLVSN